MKATPSMELTTEPAQPQEYGPTQGPHVKVSNFINICNPLKESLLDNLSGNLAELMLSQMIANYLSSE